VVDGVIAFVLVAMMWLYARWLALLAVGMTGIYALMRSIAYRLYRPSQRGGGRLCGE
jgi:ABC-type bacteriocin/lantibiotic exporter with double-glycine peptidase domain